MAQDFEQTLRDIFGESVNRLTQFQSDQIARLNAKLQEIAREALKDELARLEKEILELRARVTVLEQERVEQAAEQV
jgi:hypothetical protein